MGLAMALAMAPAGAREHEDGDHLGGAVHLAGVDRQVLVVAALVLAQLPVSIFET